MLLAACASTGSETADAVGTSAPSTGDGNVSVEGSATQSVEAALGEDLGDVDLARKNRVVTGGLDPDEVICRRERQTGSNFTVRTCMTRAEIEERAKNDQEIMEVYQRKRACTVGRSQGIPTGC